MSSRISSTTGTANDASPLEERATGTARSVCNSEGSARENLPGVRHADIPLPPAMTDRKLQDLLAQHCGVHLHVKQRMMFPNDAPSYSIIERVTLIPAQGREMELGAALELIEIDMAPAPDHRIEGWLAELSMVVRMPREDRFNADLRLAVWTDRLRHYPADIVYHALRYWPDIGIKVPSLRTSARFWPAWAEIFAILESQSQWRRKVHAAIKLEGLP